MKRWALWGMIPFINNLRMAKQSVPVIGKDVIESLTIGMYEDSRFIFREYIQNAADQIDKAIAEG